MLDPPFGITPVLLWVMVLWIGLGIPSWAVAQEQPEQRFDVKVWHGLVVAAGGLGLFPVDEPVMDYSQERRSDARDRVADVFRQLGEPFVALPAGLAVFGAGLVSGNDAVKRTGARMTTSVALAAAVVGGGKFVLGRERPFVSGDPWQFDPFSGLNENSMPSGHTAAAFALATTLGDDIGNPIVSVVLYSLAAGTGWSRINDNRHWLSDVVLGAVLGVTTAKFVSGRWTVLGIGTASYLDVRRPKPPGGSTAAIGMGHPSPRGVRLGVPALAPSADGGIVLSWNASF